LTNLTQRFAHSPRRTEEIYFESFPVPLMPNEPEFRQAKIGIVATNFKSNRIVLSNLNA